MKKGGGGREEEKVEDSVLQLVADCSTKIPAHPPRPSCNLDASLKATSASSRLQCLSEATHVNATRLQ
jgi:hypothetical protein